MWADRFFCGAVGLFVLAGLAFVFLGARKDAP
jgi:hypothetical protein